MLELVHQVIFLVEDQQDDYYQLLGVNFLFGILGVNFFLSAPLLSLFSLLSLGIK